MLKDAVPMLGGGSWALLPWVPLALHNEWKLSSMSGFKNSDDFNERLSTAAKARQALLEKFRARPRSDDPAVMERQAVRLAIGQARDARKEVRAAETARVEAAAIHQAAEDVARKATAEAEKAAQEVALEAERKSARDARYAARKARRR
jgi:Family of unknown function (DUF6481)